MKCYREDDGADGSGSGEELRFPASVARGEALSCYVNASMMWDPDLQLVVTDCRFTTAPAVNHTTLTYHFIRNKYAGRHSVLSRRSALGRVL